MSGYSDRPSLTEFLLPVLAGVTAAVLLSAAGIAMAVVAMRSQPTDNVCRICKGAGEVEISATMKECPFCEEGIIE